MIPALNGYDHHGLYRRHPHVAWDDLTIAPETVKPGDTPPTWTNWGNLKLLLFSDLRTESVQFARQLPHGYKPNTDFDFHVHWTQIDADSGSGVRWSMTYRAAPVGGIFSAEATLAITDTTVGSADYHNIVSLGTIPGESLGLGISSMIIGKLSRIHDHAEDTYGQKAGLLEADFHYPLNSVGSQYETTK